VTLVETRRGQAAEDTINAGKRWTYYKPAMGEEFYVAGFAVRVNSGPKATFELSTMDFVIEADGELLRQVILAMDNDIDAALSPGGEHTGWVPFQIPQGAKVGALGYGSKVWAGVDAWFSAQ
jgi:hypothetical protein